VCELIGAHKQRTDQPLVLAVQFDLDNREDIHLLILSLLFNQETKGQVLGAVGVRISSTLNTRGPRVASGDAERVAKNLLCYRGNLRLR
jgi:hypothetical protein